MPERNLSIPMSMPMLCDKSSEPSPFVQAATLIKEEANKKVRIVCHKSKSFNSSAAKKRPFGHCIRRVKANS